MMGHVAEQDQHGQQASGEPPEGQPPAVDSEQLRQFQQFQEFQRFQELQRQAGNEAVPTQPPKRRRRPPRWLRWLGMKVLGWLVFVLLTAIAAIWLINSLLGSDDEQLPASKTGGGKYHTNTILPTKPYETVRTLYDQIAKQAKPSYACGLFNDSARQEFVANLADRDCGKAIRDLGTQVDHATDYAESIDTDIRRPIPVERVRISSCEFDISGGPALGTFIVERVERGQWLIVGHEDGPAQCPEPSTQ